jgi:hypothetical protein
MAALHISQDETGYWQLTLEHDDGTLTLLSHQFPSPNHLIADARELVAEGKVPDAAIVIGPPAPPVAVAAARADSRGDYATPAPRKVSL